ncbi:hypothetical protein VCR20J5_170148 [Vibrio crassostreae]|nr:hypothetical protein VCR20J5_170148 [Vibrio crassostreae]CDT69695.1 hypothetical protein VCR15J5_80074 [Vibrio crassostreae]
MPNFLLFTVFHFTIHSFKPDTRSEMRDAKSLEKPIRANEILELRKSELETFLWVVRISFTRIPYLLLLSF